MCLHNVTLFIKSDLLYRCDNRVMNINPSQLLLFRKVTLWSQPGRGSADKVLEVQVCHKYEAMYPVLVLQVIHLEIMYRQE